MNVIALKCERCVAEEEDRFKAPQIRKGSVNAAFTQLVEGDEYESAPLLQSNDSHDPHVGREDMMRERKRKAENAPGEGLQPGKWLNMAGSWIKAVLGRVMEEL